MATLLALLAILALASPRASAQTHPAVVHESWSVRDGLPTNLLTDILQSRTGYIWIATFDGLVRFDGVRFVVFNSGNSEGLPGNRIVALSESPDTTLWLVTEQLELVSYRDGVFHATGQRGQPKALVPDTLQQFGEVARSIVDREGSTWIATRQNGLHRLKPAVFNVFGTPEGTHGDIFYTVATDRAGVVWAPQAPGLVRIEHDRVTHYDAPWLTGAVGFLADSRGRIWFGDVACRTPPSQCDPPVLPPSAGGVGAVFEDAGGVIWFGASTGVYRMNAGVIEHPAGDAPRTPVRGFAATRDGSLWMATSASGVTRYHAGKFTSVTTREGLPSDLVRAIYADADGFIWVGTEGRGIARIDGRAGNPVVVAIRQQHGLADNFVHQIIEDDFGRLWMSSNRGIFWVARAELNNFADGRTTKVRSTSYNERHGMRNREANGGAQPAGTQTPDGRLWFPTQGGIVVVDPRRIDSNRVAPNVVVEHILRTGERQRDVAIAYSALSFLAPENVRFRYRLEGYDHDWIEADTRRTAFYTKVPPGHYTFRVSAANEAGVWSERAAAAAFVIPPLFYETWWFKLLIGVTGALLIVAAVRYRIRQVRVIAEAEQLRELDRAKSRFFANVSHEFRTPLTLTIGPLEDVRAQLAATGQEDAVSRLDMALRSARRLFTLVTQVLDVAKLEAGSMSLQSRPGDIVVFTRGVASTFDVLAQRKRISFDLSAPNEPVMVSFDPDAMEKIITNLLSNAFKFTPEGGRVMVSVAKEDVAIIRVADNGPGIPARDVPHVFERFYQVDESNTRTQVGTGIGLALTQELVELQGGSIAVESSNAGGATFTVTLPLLSAAVVVPAQPPVSDDVTTLLIVDDSDDMRAYIRTRFEKRYHIIEAPDGAEGIARARAELPDLVISDVMMPGTSGHELVAALRASAETDFLPIILLTAQGEPDARIAGLEHGADDYITKPFDMRELEARVDNLIASRKRLRERFGGVPVELQPATKARAAQEPADRAFLERLTTALEANLANPEFGVAELADTVFLDRSHLFRKTKELLDETPSELLRRVRLERAAQLLKEGDDGIADIAYGVGFNSVSAFCRAFRETYDATPSTYRSRNVSSPA